jgi:hypothetical protein
MTMSNQGRIVRHGTTLRRAEAIVKNGPNPTFVEPGGQEKAQGLSTAYPESPTKVGSPEDYATLKAKLFPDEGGPVILEIEVPEEILELTEDVGGDIRFEPGTGLEELIAAWPTIPKRILPL